MQRRERIWGGEEEWERGRTRGNLNGYVKSLVFRTKLKLGIIYKYFSFETIKTNINEYKSINKSQLFNQI